MRVFLISLGLVIVGGVVVSWLLSDGPGQAAYFTSKVTTDDITEAVAVTGYAEPIEVHVVQSEVPGVVEEVLVDFNDKVRKGQVLAQLTSDIQQAKLLQAEFELEAAESALKGARAAEAASRAKLKESQATLTAARRELKTAEESRQKDLIPQSKVDARRDLVRKAEAGVDAADSQVRQAIEGKVQGESKLKAGEEAVKLVRIYLDKTSLKSSLTGVVLDKNIRVGDIVGRPKVSLTGGSSALFEIAAPLDRMRAIVNVSEADYSRVKVGQKASFGIDAYPDEVFEAEVVQIRNAPTTDRTAVSYATVLEFDNRRDPDSGEWMIKPRSTISADIEIRRTERVLAVRNTALLFTPSDFSVEIPPVEKGYRLVWDIGPGGTPRHHAVRIGITDGRVTEILEGDLKDGNLVITGARAAERTSPMQLPIGN